MPVEEAEALLATDPFAILDLAHHDVVPFHPEGLTTPRSGHSG